MDSKQYFNERVVSHLIKQVVVGRDTTALWMRLPISDTDVLHQWNCPRQREPKLDEFVLDVYGGYYKRLIEYEWNEELFLLMQKGERVEDVWNEELDIPMYNGKQSKMLRALRKRRLYVHRRISDLVSHLAFVTFLTQLSKFSRKMRHDVKYYIPFMSFNVYNILGLKSSLLDECYYEMKANKK
jgi:hypothetical protein